MNQLDQKHGRRMLAAVLAAGFALRMVLAAATEGYPYDINCFFAWGLRMAEAGPAAFYAENYFCDYPPGYLYVLGLVGRLMRLLRVNYTQTAARLLLVLVPALADCGIAAALYHTACSRHGRRLALRFAAAAAFCPVLLYDTAVWKQIDGPFSLLVLVCFLLLENGRLLPGALVYGLALAVKPQALLAGPALAVCFLRPLLTADTTEKRVAAVRDGVLGVVCALAPPVLCGLPFWGAAGLAEGLMTKYFTTASSYPYATINGFNFMAALGGNWTAQTQPVLGLLTWQQLGMAGIAAVTGYTVLLAVKAHKSGRFSPLLLAAVYTVGVFTFSHRMHERYLIFAVVLLAAAAARFGSRKLFLLAGGLSLTSLLNLAVVYTNVGGTDEFLTSAMNTLMLRFAGAAETSLCLILLATAWDICAGDEVRGFELPEPSVVPEAPAAQPAWTKGEGAFLAVVTLAVALVSFVYLGDTTAPQTCVDANGQGSLQYTVELEDGWQPVTEIWVYPGISSHNNGSLLITDQTGSILLDVVLNHSNPFTWQRYAVPETTGPLTVTVTEGQVFELSLRDASGGKVLPTLTSQSALFDEAHLVPETISQLNSFYFDEIYHARTGYESLHGMTIYETTHPPLGKNFIALGIAIFGMTAFGWRFFGTLFGVLMVPVLYLLARRLTRSRRWAAFAALLLSVDFMRFSQSRIATIDSYSAFFILLGAYCMVWYCQTALQKGIDRAILPMALGGVAFGLGCASKWTAIYSGAGLAVCYFGVLWQRRRQLVGLQGGKKQFWKEWDIAIAGGVVFYVAVPLAIYILSYWPYRLQDPGFGLTEWWSCQLHMFRYHSGLDATHGFSSAWYSWPLILRPVWYYMGSGLPADTYASIAGFFNPVVCWLGAAAMLVLFAKGLLGRATAAQRGVMVFFLCQLLPWLLVTRCTFLYHFFPCLPFLIIGLALCLQQAEQTAPVLTRRVSAGILIAAAALLVWFYPVLAGLPVSGAWAASLKWLPSWGFYIL